MKRQETWSTTTTTTITTTTATAAATTTNTAAATDTTTTAAAATTLLTNFSMIYNELTKWLAFTCISALNVIIGFLLIKQQTKESVEKIVLSYKTICQKQTPFQPRTERWGKH